MYGYLHYKDKLFVRPSHLYHGNHCTVKTTSIYWVPPRHIQLVERAWNVELTLLQTHTFRIEIIMAEVSDAMNKIGGHKLNQNSL